MDTIGKVLRQEIANLNFVGVGDGDGAQLAVIYGRQLPTNANCWRQQNNHLTNVLYDKKIQSDKFYLASSNRESGTDTL